MTRRLHTIAEAAEALGVSTSHIKRLIADADANRKSRWRWGRELIDLAPVGASRRTIRVNLGVVVPEPSPPLPQRDVAGCVVAPGMPQTETIAKVS